MSWLSDRLGVNIDACAAAHNFIDGYFSAIEAPLKAVGNIIQGQNVFDALKDVTTKTLGYVASVYTYGATDLLATKGTISDALTNSTLNKITLGNSSALVNASKGVTDLASGTSINNLPTQEGQAITQLYAEAGAVALAVVAAPADAIEAPTLTSGLETYGAAAAVDKGITTHNAGAILSGVGGIFGDSDIGDIASTAGDIYGATTPGATQPMTRPPAAAPGSVKPPTGSPVPGTAANSQSSDNTVPLIVGGLILAKLFLK